MVELYIIGLLFATLGLLNVYKPAKKIGQWGYRSERSIQSIESWQLAQQISGKGLITTGVFLLTLAFLFNALYFDPNLKPILTISACVFAVLDTIFQTEFALSKRISRI